MCDVQILVLLVYSFLFVCLLVFSITHAENVKPEPIDMWNELDTSLQVKN